MGTVLGLLGTAGRAAACGGFWCSQTAPVEQTGEQIIFAQNEDGTTTCVVQIAYQGPSEHFAWVLPVEGVPQIGVSATSAFQRLASATAPQFQLERHVQGTCKQPEYYGYPSAAGGSANYAVDAGVAAPSVDVLASGSVGPYDYVVIKPDPSLPSPAQVALDWLTKEGFDITGISSTVLGPYLADGLNLVAFRLTKGTDVGAIRPVILTYSGTKPSIPIRPTAVAAKDDMGVLVYILSGAQAVPGNYRSLVLNETLVDWFNPYGTYPAVVTAAAHQAGGQGFVTEMAGPSTVLAGVVFSDNSALDQLKQQTFADPLDLVWAANNYFRGWDGWRDAIEAAVTLPPGVSLDDFGRDPNAYRGVPGFSVDAAVFLDHLEKDVVGPVRDTQKILDSRPYFTRLYTTMSPGDMTVDPVFTFNPDLAPVSNVHTADLYIQCRYDVYEYQAPWMAVLPGGFTLSGSGTTWPLSVSGPLPANRKIVQLSETGSGEVVQDLTAQIMVGLASYGGTMTPSQQTHPSQGVPIGGYDAVPPSNSGSSGASCALGQPARDVPAGPLGATAFAAVAALVATRGRRGIRKRDST